MNTDAMAKLVGEGLMRTIQDRARDRVLALLEGGPKLTEDESDAIDVGVAAGITETLLVLQEAELLPTLEPKP